MDENKIKNALWEKAEERGETLYYLLQDWKNKETITDWLDLSESKRNAYIMTALRKKKPQEKKKRMEIVELEKEVQETIDEDERVKKELDEVNKLRKDQDKRHKEMVKKAKQPTTKKNNA